VFLAPTNALSFALVGKDGFALVGIFLVVFAVIRRAGKDRVLVAVLDDIAFHRFAPFVF
jgi:hypothetical protein